MPALRANAGGTLLAMVALVGGPWLLASGIRGRWIGGLPRDSWTIAAAVLILVTTLNAMDRAVDVGLVGTNKAGQDVQRTNARDCSMTDASRMTLGGGRFNGRLLRAHRLVQRLWPGSPR